MPKTVSAGERCLSALEAPRPIAGRRIAGRHPFAAIPGFTALELVVTVAIASFMMSLAVPGFVDLMRASQHAGVTHSLLVAINLTRAEAVKRASRVTLCAGSPACADGYHRGWSIYADINGSGSFEPADDELIRVGEPLPAGFSTPASAQVASYVSYDADGIAKQFDGSPQSGTIGVCKVALQKCIVIGRSGRPSIGAGCACP